MIEIDNLTKKYKKYVIQYNSLKSFVINFKKIKQEEEKIDELYVIKNLNLHVHQGEILCVVGKNGCGKSTLSKIIAGTVSPTSGTVKVNGTVVPFLELGVAFNPELSGKDNVFLNGVLLGIPRKEIRQKIESIFEFAELNSFVDTPIKYYSSGMVMRLAFSIGMHAYGDIYIFDEILAVGDANFQLKCFASFRRLIEEEKTIILITHDLNIVKKYATKVLLMNKDGYQYIVNNEEIQEISMEMLY